MSYVKKINGYVVKDEEARQEIENIKTRITGAMQYIGASSNALSGNTGPWIIDGITYNIENVTLTLNAQSSDQRVYTRDKQLDEYYNNHNYKAFTCSSAGSGYPSVIYSTLGATINSIEDIYAKLGITITSITNLYSSIIFRTAHNLGENETAIFYGAVATYKPENKQELEYVYGPTGWEEFGSTGSLKNLAFKDTANVTASGSCTPNGTNAASVVTFTTPGVLPTMIYDSANETLTFDPGSFPSDGVAAAQIFTGSNTDVSVSGTAS